MKRASKKTIFRPSLDDVERLSRGNSAKVRGTGSRAICHRLNRDERRQYEIAKKVGYLQTRYSGYRKERRGSPVLNTHRQYCDAVGAACVRIEKHDNFEKIVVDLSPLRVENMQPYLDFLERFIEKLDGATEISVSDKQLLNHDDLLFPIWALPETMISVQTPKGLGRAAASDIVELTAAFHDREKRTAASLRA